MLHFLFTTRRPLHELDTQIIIAHELKYITEADFNRLSSLSEELGKILNGLIHRFQAMVQNQRHAA